MNLGASMLAKRVHQTENEIFSYRNLLIYVPASVLLGVALYWIGAVIF